MDQQPSPEVKLTKKQNLIQAVKFLLFSCSAGIIQAGTFTLLNELVHWPGVLADAEYGPNYFIALLLSVLWNFTINRKFTFKSAANVPVAMLKVLGYYCVFTPLSILWGIALTRAGWNEYIVLFGTMVINLVTEFLFCKFVVYRKDMFTNKAGQAELERTRQEQDAAEDTPVGPE